MNRDAVGCHDRALFIEDRGHVIAGIVGNNCPLARVLTRKLHAAELARTLPPATRAPQMLAALTEGANFVHSLDSHDNATICQPRCTLHAA